VFSVLALVLLAADIVPESTSIRRTSIAAEPTTVSSTAEHAETVALPTPQSRIPMRIVIDRIGVDSSVLTPSSSDITVLDRALLSGAVQYPGSVSAGNRGNMLIFGHSSYLPVVHNQAYRAFNKIGTLELGDIVRVYSDTHIYRYVVKSVRLANADETIIYFDTPVPTLTLATCNTFGAKQERWVVIATLQDELPYGGTHR